MEVVDANTFRLAWLECRSLPKLADSRSRFVTKDWLDPRLTNLLREHNVALALTDTSFMPRPWEMKEKFDLVTADFAYVRWLGDRKGIEKQTTTWDKTVVDRTNDLRNWVEVFKSLVSNTKVLKIFAFSNNHYAGHGPATAKLLRRLCS